MLKMADDSRTEAVDPLLMAAKSGLLGQEIGRVVCMTHAKARRVQEGLADFNDSQGGPVRVGAWKGRRSG